MALVGLSVISIFKCKCHYRSRVLRQIMEKTMDTDGRWKTEDKLSLPMSEFIFFVGFSQLTNCYISTKHVKLSAMAADRASQTTPVQITCCVVLHKLSTCNFDSGSICVEQHNINKTCVICTRIYLTAQNF